MEINHVLCPTATRLDGPTSCVTRIDLADAALWSAALGAAAAGGGVPVAQTPEPVAPPEVPPTVPPAPKRSCVICLDRQPRIACVPCGHLAFCVACAEDVGPTGIVQSCPICRAPVTSKLPVYVA